MKIYFLFIFLLIGLVCCKDYKNPYKEGKYAFEKHCGTCHGNNGEGLGSLITNLNDLEFINKNRNQLPCMLIKGIHNDSSSVFITRHGDQEMPKNELLTTSDIVNILNYLNYNLWKMETFDFRTIDSQMNRCSGNQK